MSAEVVAKALGGLRTRDGGFLCSCPLSTHGKGRGDRNPSLSVADGDKGILVNCFGGCAPVDILDELRSRSLLPDRAERFLEQTANIRQRRPVTPAPDEHLPDPRAVAIWRAAHMCADREVVRRYVGKTRRISLALPPTIRQGAELRGNVPLPTMVAAVQAPNGQVIAVQQTLLTWSAAKAPVAVPRLTLGALGEGAVRLGPAEETLGLAEGLETALAAMELSGITSWATLGSQRLSRIRLPQQVRTVMLFADNDEPGRRAAEQAAERYEREGRRVLIRRPPEGFGDWNDVLMAEANA